MVSYSQSISFSSQSSEEEILKVSGFILLWQCYLTIVWMSQSPPYHKSSLCHDPSSTSDVFISPNFPSVSVLDAFRFIYRGSSLEYWNVLESLQHCSKSELYRKQKYREKYQYKKSIMDTIRKKYNVWCSYCNVIFWRG